MRQLQNSMWKRSRKNRPKKCHRENDAVEWKIEQNKSFIVDGDHRHFEMKATENEMKKIEAV